MLPELVPVFILGISLLIGGALIGAHNNSYYSNEAISRRVLGETRKGKKAGD